MLKVRNLTQASAIKQRGRYQGKRVDFLTEQVRKVLSTPYSGLIVMVRG